MLENFRRDHPQDELQPEVTRKLAVAYLEGGQQRKAAVEFERVAARDAEDAGGAPRCAVAGGRAL